LRTLILVIVLTGGRLLAVVGLSVGRIVLASARLAVRRGVLPVRRVVALGVVVGLAMLVVFGLLLARILLLLFTGRVERRGCGRAVVVGVRGHGGLVLLFGDGAQLTLLKVVVVALVGFNVVGKEVVEIGLGTRGRLYRWLQIGRFGGVVVMGMRLGSGVDEGERGVESRVWEMKG
jgi:hypothetical protein